MKGSFDLFLETMQSYSIPKGGLILESFFYFGSNLKKKLSEIEPPLSE